MTQPLTYSTHERLSLKTHPEFNEAWLHNRIKENPSIIGLGDLRLLDHERRHGGAGRLDLLLFDEDSNRRYEVEVMLGATDPSHIIRTIEYWDIERRRYPGYEHVAVLIAEDITSRFLNVLSLMSGSIPFIAIQLSALRVENHVVLDFIRILDQTELRIDDTVEESGGSQVDRKYWDQQAGPKLMAICDALLEMINAHARIPRQLNYLDSYIGLIGNGLVDNFVAFNPRKQKQVVRVDFRTVVAQSLVERFESAGLAPRRNSERIVGVMLTSELLETHRELINQTVIETVQENNA